MKLATCIQQFFADYLPRIKGSSEQTAKTYRDCFTLLLPFAARYHGIKIPSLRLEHLCCNLILDFLDYLETERHNTPRTRNQRLAAIKSLAKMIRFMYPDKHQLATTILSIPQKRTQKQLIGFLYPEEIQKIFQAVDLRTCQGFRDYTILHLLYDSGARASEIATLNLDYFDPHNKTLAILGKGNRYRLLRIWPKTTALIQRYVTTYRPTPKPLYQHRLFINQRRGELTRHGIYRLCKKYIEQTLTPKRLKQINPVHSFRHACAVTMLCAGKSISDIQNRLGHENIESTMVYLKMDLTRRREVQKKFLAYTQSFLTKDPKLDELIDWENRAEILAWLDSL
jgi:site-specific recombinase XerD